MATDEGGLQRGRPVQTDGGRTRQGGAWVGPRAERDEDKETGRIVVSGRRDGGA